MTENAAGAGNGESASGRGNATPRRELARLREELPKPAREFHQRLGEAMLVASGELGYRNVTIRDVLERAGASRVRFYRQFENKEDCFTRSYAVAIEELCGRLLGAAAAAPSWRMGLRAALRELGDFAVARPALARGMLAEAYIAGRPTMAKREEVFKRLTRVMDSARRETDASRHSPPPITAAFMVSAIEQAVVVALVKGEPESFEAGVPELIYLTSIAFFGAKIAREELAAARS